MAAAHQVFRWPLSCLQTSGKERDTAMQTGQPQYFDAYRSVRMTRELASLYLKAPEVTRRNTRAHFIRPLKERIVREVGYGLSLEGASAADLVKSMHAGT